MEDNLQLFAFESQQVRALEIKSEPWFIGKDVAEILGYKLPTKAIQDHVDAEDKRSEIVKASQFFQNGKGGKGYVNVDLINESGVYALIFGSKMPNANKFKHWVTSEVLPAIRKHGAYMTDEKAFDVVHNKNGLADLLQQAADQLKSKNIQIKEMKPISLRDRRLGDQYAKV